MAAKLHRGDFRQRITFRTVAKTRDASGEYSEVYLDLLTTWAKVDSKSGQRTFVQGEDYAVDRKTIYVYQRPALDVITRDTRIRYVGVDYGIDNKTFVDELNEILKFEVTALKN